VNIIARVARRILVRTAANIARHARLTILLFVALAGIIAASALNVSLPAAGTSPSGAGGTYRATSQDEPSATAEYLRGQQSYDAKLIWESYSDRVIRDLERRGNSLEDTQRQLDRAKEVGRRIEQAQYIGGHPIPNGSMHMYVVLQAPARAAGSERGDVAYVPYVFTLDSQGKIERVE
jgi:hypothetical protein